MRRLLALILAICIFVPWPVHGEDDGIVSAQLAESMPLVGIDKVHQEYGLTGRGVGIYIFDYFSASNAEDHGWFVKAIIETIAPDATIWYCDMNARHAFGGTPNCIDSLMEDRSQYAQISIVNASVVSGKFQSGASFSCDAESVLGNVQAPQVLESIREKLWVSAVGNTDSENALLFPACLDGVLSVGATHDSGSNVDQLANISKRPPFMDVVAPGAPTVTPWPGKKFWGTSAATPIVTGISALLLEANPGLRPSQIASILKSTGEPALDPITGVYYPRVNAYRAVQSILGSGDMSQPISSDIEIVASSLSKDEITQSEELCVRLELLNRGRTASVPIEIVSGSETLHSTLRLVESGHTSPFSLCFRMSRLGSHRVEILQAPDNHRVGTVEVVETAPTKSIIRLPSGDSNGIAAIFDSNHNGFLDDFELFHAVDFWINEQVSDELLFRLVDAWIGQTRLQSVSGRGDLWSYELFDLQGNELASGNCMARMGLGFRAQESLAARSASNGVYVLRESNCDSGAQRVSFIALAK